MNKPKIVLLLFIMYLSLSSVAQDHIQKVSIKGVIGIVSDLNCAFGDSIVVRNKNHEVLYSYVKSDEYQIWTAMCLQVTDAEYTIQLSDGKYGYVSTQTPNILFQSIEDHILKLFAVGFNASNSPRESPSDNAQTLKSEDADYYIPFKIQGDWLQNTWETHGVIETGWVRWRANDNLIIEFFYFA